MPSRTPAYHEQGVTLTVPGAEAAVLQVPGTAMLGYCPPVSDEACCWSSFLSLWREQDLELLSWENKPCKTQIHEKEHLS